MFTKIKAYGLQVLALGLGLLLALQTWRLHIEQLSLATLKTEIAEADRNRATANLKANQRNSWLTFNHAQKTQENSDVFTISQPVRDAIARADLAIAQRLYNDARRRAATYRAMSEANAAACRHLADRHTALDAHVVRGAAVVAGLRSDLVKRDAEVGLLCAQVNTERHLSGEKNSSVCSVK